MPETDQNTENSPINPRTKDPNLLAAHEYILAYEERRLQELTKSIAWRKAEIEKLQKK